MVITRYGEITFNHFMDNPSWAAAAGYDFNFIDCISASAQCVFNIGGNLANEILDIPDAEVRELPAFMIKMLLGSLILAVMVFCYPIFAIAIYFRCKSMTRKYKDDYSEIVSHNLRFWQQRVYRRSMNANS